MKKVFLLSSGACSRNPGPGGWASMLRYDVYKKVVVGKEESTTNNRMHLRAVIEGLKKLKWPCDITISTNSKYITDAYNEGYIEKWRPNLISRTNGDLWKELDDIIKESGHTAHFIWSDRPYHNDYKTVMRLAEEQACQ